MRMAPVLGSEWCAPRRALARLRRVFTASCLACCGVVFACRNDASIADFRSTPSAENPGTEALPALTLTDETPNLLLTWIGDDGDFHVVEKIADVPADRRAQVRVVITDKAMGTGQTVYVADLGTKRGDGSYAVTTLPRSEWEKLGADRRKTRMEALAPGQASGQPPGSSPDAAAAGGAAGAAEGAPAGTVTAIIYGADWCKPCHDAERYLKSLGVAVTKKDIEESRAAQAEMREKLQRVNRMGASIPVIDIMGKIFIGYSPGPLKQAVDAARHAMQRHG